MDTAKIIKLDALVDKLLACALLTGALGVAMATCGIALLISPLTTRAVTIAGSALFLTAVGTFYFLSKLVGHCTEYTKMMNEEYHDVLVELKGTFLRTPSDHKPEPWPAPPPVMNPDPNTSRPDPPPPPPPDDKYQWSQEARG